MVGGRPKPSPCLKLFSFLYPKTRLPAVVTLDDQTVTYEAEIFDQNEESKVQPVLEVNDIFEVPLCFFEIYYHFCLDKIAVDVA